MKPPPLRSSWQNLWYSETISCCETTKHRATHRPNQTVVAQKPRRISMLNAATYRCCCSALALLQCRIEWASRTCCPWCSSITIRLGLWEWQATKNPNSNCPFVRGRRWKMAFLLLPTTTFVDRWYGVPVGLRLVTRVFDKAREHVTVSATVVLRGWLGVLTFVYTTCRFSLCNLPLSSASYNNTTFHSPPKARCLLC